MTGGTPAPPEWSFHDVRLAPHYRVQSPLEEVLAKLEPGSDEFLSEKFATEILGILQQWRSALENAPLSVEAVASFLDPRIKASWLGPPQESVLRADGGLEIVRRSFPQEIFSGRDSVSHAFSVYLNPLVSLETAEFEIVSLHPGPGSLGVLEVQLRYDLVGNRKDGWREERIGHWLTEWERQEGDVWRVRTWKATEETCSRARHAVFVDITANAFGPAESYRHQLRRGLDDWRTVLDGACGIDIYGNQGVAVGDADGDGLDDIYICQPSGLPNRLYRNRGDGTFEDVTEQAGVGVLDSTPCALFADFNNNGLEDLLVVTGTGPLLFLNQGGGRFALHREAFKFAQPPQGTFTAAAVADYDRDGLLDVYFCVYSYYLGLDQYHYPTPYFDAQNGPPNFLFHNEGRATFQDRTSTAGLNVNNNRYSFACAWQDFDGDGFPDLYVANDFGRKNLYRNNRDGTFTDVAREAGVEDIGAGMSASWLDFDNDGNPDLYVGDMWSAAGMRITSQTAFQKNCPENVRGLYQKHARGNSLYRNLGGGRFEDVSAAAGVEFGRWAWSSDAWDFDQDGYPDLYVANGYISAAGKDDLSSFFWRQVVAESPATQVESKKYEEGWNAINELIRSDHSWNGRERNVFFANNRDGTFSEISGVVGLDFVDDGRAFALGDLDQDGRLEVILKNRTGPQVRVLKNTSADLGNCIAIGLRGNPSNRNAIGAAVTVEAGGLRQTKSLQGGTGFLSQHSKELFFGLGKAEGPVNAMVRWPNGSTQAFRGLPRNQRVKIEEGSKEFKATAFRPSPEAWARPVSAQSEEPIPTSVETWLIQPLPAPGFLLPDLQGHAHSLESLKGRQVLLYFWTMKSTASQEGLAEIEKARPVWDTPELKILGLNADAAGSETEVRSFVAAQRFTFDILLSSEEIAAVYNILYRYLFDRRRDLGFPTAFLIDEAGLIVKIYQGRIDPGRVVQDTKSLPRTAEERIRRALPFGGDLYGGEFRRNDFTYGVAFFQRGYLDQAVASFKHVIASQPEYPEAYYNLGTLYLKQGDLLSARGYLERAVLLRPDYPDAWNNLGMIAAQRGEFEDAVTHFQRALSQKPDYGIALENLGNLYRGQGSYPKAEKLLSQALATDPDNPEFNYSLGMLFAQKGDFERAGDLLNKAVTLRPDYPDALNNLGVLLVREGKTTEAVEKFEQCIRVAPDQDEGYLNLARIYVMMGNKEKAREVLRQFLARQPQHPAARQALQQLQE